MNLHPDFAIIDRGEAMMTATPICGEVVIGIGEAGGCCAEICLTSEEAVEFALWLLQAARLN